MTVRLEQMLDPVKIAHEQGRITGQRQMRDRARDILATHATTHPDPRIRAELWRYIRHIETLDIT